MALDQLLSALEREAHATAERLLTEARSEVARLTAIADDDIARRREAAVAPRIRQARAEMEGAIGIAGRAARGEVLRARERFLARTFAAARTALGNVSARDDYRTSAGARIDAAVACVGGGEEIVIRCPGPLLEAIREAVRGRAGISVAVDNTIASGFVLATSSGSLVVDDTLESRLDRNAVSLSRIALQALEDPA